MAQNLHNPFRLNQQLTGATNESTTTSGTSRTTVSVAPTESDNTSRPSGSQLSSTPAMTSPTTTSAAATANVTSSADNRTLGIDDLEEPPPYTPRADSTQGEQTVEYGPARPFQPPPQQLQQQIQPTPTPYLSPHSTGLSHSHSVGSIGRSSGGGGLWRQLTQSIDQIAAQIERQYTSNNGQRHGYGVSPQPTGATSTSWSSYPGARPIYAPPSGPPPSMNQNQNRSVPHPPPPPRHPRSMSSVSLPNTNETVGRSTTSSEFSRDFYAAGADINVDQEEGRGQGSRTDGPNEEETGPTKTPVPGRPLLNQGKLLVYPKGHTCDKCFNTGYKNYDPTHPCKKCWSKYGKPFTGPLAYSYSNTSSTTSNTQNINLQKPLPRHMSRPAPPPPRPIPVPPPPPPPPQHRPSNFGYMQQNGPGMMRINSGYGPPPPGSVICRPGDPRIGGNLCWSCSGKGTVRILFDSVSCPICGGCGRTFG